MKRRNRSSRKIAGFFAIFQVQQLLDFKNNQQFFRVLVKFVFFFLNLIPSNEHSDEAEEEESGKSVPSTRSTR